MAGLFRTALIVLALGAAPARAEDVPTEWDGLVKVNSRNFDAVYLAPGVNFASYTKVMIDPTEAAFHRNWQRNYNSSVVGLEGRITDGDARRALELVQSGFQEEFREAYVAAGYQVVTEPGADVLRLRTAVLNIRVTAPDQMTAARTRTFAEDTGEATLVIEARDSMSNALLGRSVDRRLIGGNSAVLWRNRASNRADFSRVFRSWAEKSAQALAALRATPAPAATTPPTGQ